MKHDGEKKQRRARSRKHATTTTTTDGRDSLVTRGEVSERARFTVTAEESFRRQSASDDEKGGGRTTTTARARTTTTTTTTTENYYGLDSKFYTGRVERWDRDGAREARVRETLAAASAAKAPRRNDFYAAGRRRFR